MEGTHVADRGFTLVELMIVLALLSLLLSLGLPAFQQLQISTRIQVQVHRLLASIVLTRSEAIKRNLPVVMCATPNGDECSGVFADGWMIFVDSDSDRQRDSNEELIRVEAALPDGYTVTNRAATRNANEQISYRPDGSARRNLTLMVCSSQRPDIASWSVVLNLVGRPRLARAWGDCPVTAGS